MESQKVKTHRTAETNAAAVAVRQSSSTLDRSITRDFLGLVMHPHVPSEDEIARWPDALHMSAQKWAGACHLSASDNIGVRVPPRPYFLDDDVPGGVHEPLVEQAIEQAIGRRARVVYTGLVLGCAHYTTGELNRNGHCNAARCALEHDSGGVSFYKRGACVAHVKTLRPKAVTSMARSDAVRWVSLGTLPPEPAATATVKS